MNVTRVSRRRVATFAVLAPGSMIALGAVVSLMVDDVASAPRRSVPRVEATARLEPPRVDSARRPPASLPELKRALELARTREGPHSQRERYQLIQEIGRVSTFESRRFLVELASGGAGDEATPERVDRVAAVSALATQDDKDALRTIAARSKDPMVLAKVDAVSKKAN